jgi:hypothetical protein
MIVNASHTFRRRAKSAGALKRSAMGFASAKVTAAMANTTISSFIEQYYGRARMYNGNYPG